MTLEGVPQAGVRVSFLDGGRQIIASKGSSSRCGRCGLLVEMLRAVDRGHVTLTTNPERVTCDADGNLVCNMPVSRDAFNPIVISQQ